MIAIILIGIAAGCASALMVVSIASGALVSLLLLYLAPLPLMVAALGWGPLSAVIGGVAAGVGFGAFFGLSYCLAFVIAIMLPACWLGHLALLGRPVAAATTSANLSPDHGASTTLTMEPTMEWYPIGRLLLWIAGFAALTTLSMLLTLGTDAAAISAALRRSWMTILGLSDSSTGKDGPWIEALVAISPIAAVITATLTLILNMWLAAKIAATSGRLRRPWPRLKDAALPPMTLVVLPVALAICFTGGLFAMMAQVAAGALVMAYTFIGFAVLHTLTLTLKGRAFLLSCTYAIVIVFSWPLLAMAALGIADAFFGFRQRYLRGRPPLPAS
jgi:hypothetical protein